MAQGILFQHCFITSDFLKILAVLQYFLICVLLLIHHKNNVFEYTKEVHKMGDSVRYPVMKSVKDAAAVYNLSPAYIRRLCRIGKVRFVDAGHRWLVNMDSLARYFEAGDPVPAEQGEAVGGIRRVAGR